MTKEANGRDRKRGAEPLRDTEQSRHAQEPWLSQTHTDGEHGDLFAERVRRVNDIRERGNQISKLCFNMISESCPRASVSSPGEWVLG